MKRRKTSIGAHMTSETSKIYSGTWLASDEALLTPSFFFDHGRRSSFSWFQTSHVIINTNDAITSAWSSLLSQWLVVHFW